MSGALPSEPPSRRAPASSPAASSQQAAGHPLLQVDNLTKLFTLPGHLLGPRRFVRAVDDVSLFIMPHETLGVVGESGCGKTTLTRCVLRLQQPDFGQIAFEGENITDLHERALRPVRRRMQPVFQDPRTSLDPELTVHAIVAEGLELGSSKERSRASELASHWLSRVGLTPEFERRKPAELSAGERQRVALARALAVEPALVVCDEPLSALDVSVRAQMVNLLLDLQDELGLGYLFISHDLATVRYLSHRIVVMLVGRVVETGPAELVHEQPGHPYTRALVNAIPAISGTPRLPVLLDGPRSDSAARFSGCALTPRCPRAERGVCDVERPALSEIGPGHWVACHHPLT